MRKHEILRHIELLNINLTDGNIKRDTVNSVLNCLAGLDYNINLVNDYNAYIRELNNMTNIAIPLIRGQRYYSVKDIITA